MSSRIRPPVATAGASVSNGPAGQLNYTAATAGNANQAEAARCYTPVDLVVDRIGIYIGTSAGNIDLGVYADTTGAPSTRLASIGSTASPGTGARLFTITEITIPTGFYWIAMVADGTSFSCGYWSTPQWWDAYATDTLLSTSSRGYSLASAFPLPSPWSGGSTTTTPRLVWVEHS